MTAQPQHVMESSGVWGICAAAASQCGESTTPIDSRLEYIVTRSTANLGHWQSLALLMFLAPLAVVGTGAAIARGHAGLVALPAIFYVVLVAHLVSRTVGHPDRTARPRLRPDEAQAGPRETDRRAH